MFFFFFFNDTATTEIYTLSLHDALPIWSKIISAGSSTSLPGMVSPAPGYQGGEIFIANDGNAGGNWYGLRGDTGAAIWHRSEEHTSELQSQSNLVCRLLL